MLNPSVFVEASSVEPAWETEDQIRIGIQGDPSLSAVLAFLLNEPEKAPRTVQDKFKRYAWLNGLLYLDNRILVPDDDDLKRRILESCHDAPTSGHPGREQTREMVRRQYTWPAMTQFVHRYVDSCDTCQRNKVAHAIPVPAQPLPVPMGP